MKSFTSYTHLRLPGNAAPASTHAYPNLRFTRAMSVTQINLKQSVGNIPVTSKRQSKTLAFPMYRTSSSSHVTAAGEATTDDPTSAGTCLNELYVIIPLLFIYRCYSELKLVIILSSLLSLS